MSSANSSALLTSSPSIIDFQYTPLKRESRQIRLLKIKPIFLENTVSCTLETFASPVGQVSTPLNYIALSYTWGPRNLTNEIWVNSKRLMVRRNLWEFLMIAREQFPDELFWIDQICINQNSNEEKNHQVALMAQIYRNAYLVVVWLGPAADDSNFAMDYIYGHSYSFTDRVQRAIKLLFARPYWKRLWVVQETQIAQNVLVVCGTMEKRGFPTHFVDDCLSGDNKQYAGLINPSAATLILGNDIRWWREIDPIFMKGRALGRYTECSLAAQTLRHNIYMYCHFNCANPRDKIYGFLGLVRFGEMPFEEAILAVDYNKSVKEVFWDFFKSSSFDYLSTFNNSYEVLPYNPLPGWFDFGITLMKEMDIYSSRNELEIKKVLDRMDHLRWYGLQENNQLAQRVSYPASSNIAIHDGHGETLKTLRPFSLQMCVGAVDSSNTVTDKAEVGTYNLRPTRIYLPSLLYFHHILSSLWRACVFLLGWVHSKSPLQRSQSGNLQ